MGRERNEEGETLQERRSPTPDADMHRKAKRGRKGPYVVTSHSFTRWEGDDWPSYFMVTHVDAVTTLQRRNYLKTEVYGEGRNWTYKEASRNKKELERISKEQMRREHDVHN